MQDLQARDNDRNARAIHGADPLIAFASAPLALHYLTATEFADALAQHGSQLLGAAAFGAPPMLSNSASCPLINIAMPLIAGDGLFEVWSSAQAVQTIKHDAIRARCTESILFGCFELAQSATQSMQALTYAAYTALFEFLDAQGYAHLWRIWHYLPDINGLDHGQERYHGFNVGRHEAFQVKGRTIGDQQVPAACALGSRGHSLAVYFIAGRVPGRAVENPRQMSAYRYPPQYGPRSPTFARAMLTQIDDCWQFFISGTASIVGHASQHPNDMSAQTRETLLNVQTLLEQAHHAGLDYQAPGARLYLKVYLHQPQALPEVQAQIRALLGDVDAVYLQADVCRSDLLLEIEGVCLTSTQWHRHPGKS